MSERLGTLALERARIDRPAARLVLVAIALHARDSSTPAYPSLSRLASMTGLTRRAVYRIVADLEESGDLTVLRSGTKANRYLVHPGGTRDAQSLSARDGRSPELGTELGTGRHQLGTLDARTRDPRSPELEEPEGTRRENARANGGEPVRWQDGDAKYLNSPSEQIRAKTREAAERAGIDWRAVLAEQGAAPI